MLLTGGYANYVNGGIAGLRVPRFHDLHLLKGLTCFDSASAISPIHEKKCMI